MSEKKNKEKYPLIPATVIVSALEQDPISIKMILKHYHRYITSLSISNGFNENNQLVTYVDEFILRQLETKLIAAILKFEVK